MHTERQLLIAGILLSLCTTGASAQFEEPRHPLSQINPIDVPLNMSNEAIINISVLSVSNPSGDGFNIDNYAITDTTGANRLEFDPSRDQFQVQGSELNLSGNNLTAPDNIKTGGKSVTIRDSSNNKDILRAKEIGQAGTIEIPNGNLSLNGNNITQVKRINGRLVQNIGTSSLAQALNKGNKARNNNINMSGNKITNLSDPTDPQDAATQSYVNDNDDTIQDNQGLEEVLSLDNKVGGENINFNETSSIQASGTNAITLNQNQNIGIPNGNLKLGDNSISSASALEVGTLSSLTEFYSFEQNPNLEGTEIFRQRQGLTVEYDTFNDDSVEVLLNATTQVRGQAFERTFLNLTRIRDVNPGDNIRFEQSQDEYDSSFSDKAIAKLRTESGEDILRFKARQDFATDPNGLVRVENTSNSGIIPLGEIAPGDDVEWEVDLMRNGMARVNASNLIDGYNSTIIGYNRTLLGTETNLLIGLFTSKSSKVYYDNISYSRDIEFQSGIDLRENSINNFFDQNKCGDNEAIKTVYPNGSYVCNSISTTTSAENLSETLEAGNVANQSLTVEAVGSPVKVVELGSSDGRISARQFYTFDRGSLDGVKQTPDGSNSFARVNSTLIEEDGDFSLKINGSARSSVFPEKRVNFSELNLLGRGGSVSFEVEVVSSRTSTNEVLLIDPDGEEVFGIQYAPFKDNIRTSPGSTKISDLVIGEGIDTKITYLRNGSVNITVQSPSLGTQSRIIPASEINLNGDETLQASYKQLYTSGEEAGYILDDLAAPTNLEVSRGLNLTNDTIYGLSRLENFFDQGKCGSDEAVKTVLPNGSYICNSISTTTEAENLSETLSSGDSTNGEKLNVDGGSELDASGGKFRLPTGDVY